MEKKLLVLDIDGTLVNNKKEITPRTRDAIRKTLEQGHSVMIASGRPTPGIRQYIDELELVKYGGYALTYNGARVQNLRTGQDIYTKKLPNKIVRPIYEYACRNDLGIITYDQGPAPDPQVISGRRLDQWIQLEADINHLTVGVQEDFPEYVDFDVYKLLLTADPEKSEGYMLELQKLVGDTANVMRSEAFFIEITARHVDKARTISKVIGPIGISQSNTICCGDGFNDITMLDFAGVGVAMGNAKPEVKAVANYITATNEEDGIAEVIERFILE